MADERRGAYVVAKIRQIEYEIGIITGLSRGFEQRRARADGADARCASISSCATRASFRKIGGRHPRHGGGSPEREG